ATMSAVAGATPSALEPHRRVHARAEEALPDADEAVGDVRHEEAGRAVAARTGEPTRVEERPHGARRLLGGVDEGHPLANHLGDHGPEERVVRAGEDERVDAALPERREVGLDDAARDRPLDPPLLGERHEERARSGVYLEPRTEGAE